MTPTIYNEFHERIDAVVEGKLDAKATIVFVHGFGANKNEGENYFVDVANALKDNYRIVRFDFAGCGQSEGRQEDVNYEKQAKDLEAVLSYVKKECGERIYIYAHSMGCFITALLNPNGIEKVVMSSIPNTNTTYLADFFDRWISQKPGGSVDRQGISIFPRSAGGVQKIGPSFWSVLTSFAPLETVSRFAQKTKLLIIHAKQDPIIGTEYVKEYANISGAEDVWVDGDHNYTKKEDRDIVIEKVKKFFNTNIEEKVFVPNKKGLKLAAVMHRPKGRGLFPGVIVLTGFGMNKDDLHVRQLCEDLASSGFAAIRFETAGMGESEGGVEEFLLTNYYNDVDVIYEYFSGLDFVDTERIGMVGHSLGAVVTLLYAAKNPLTIKVLCAISPPSTFSTVHLDISIEEWKEQGFYPKQKPTGESVHIPYAFVEDADKAEVLELVRNLTQPKLIIVGSDDKVVDPEDTKEIYDHAAEPKELAEIEEIGHMYKKYPEQVALVNKKVIDFLKENL